MAVCCECTRLVERLIYGPFRFASHIEGFGRVSENGSVRAMAAITSLQNTYLGRLSSQITRMINSFFHSIFILYMLKAKNPLTS